MVRKDVESGLVRFFAGRPGVAAAYLFGSQARGTARLDSDVDIAVLLDPDPPPGMGSLALDLEGEIESLLGCEVQLVVLNHAPVDLIHRVLRDGVLVAERDRSKRIRFEVRARNEYFDLLPYLREYRDRGSRGRVVSDG